MDENLFFIVINSKFRTPTISPFCRLLRVGRRSANRTACIRKTLAKPGRQERKSRLGVVINSKFRPSKISPFCRLLRVCYHSKGKATSISSTSDGSGRKSFFVVINSKFRSSTIWAFYRVLRVRYHSKGKATSVSSTSDASGRKSFFRSDKFKISNADDINVLWSASRRSSLGEQNGMRSEGVDGTWKTRGPGVVRFRSEARQSARFNFFGRHQKRRKALKNSNEPMAPIERALATTVARAAAVRPPATRPSSTLKLVDCCSAMFEKSVDAKTG